MSHETLIIYECEHCETALGPGLIACPNCGQDFDEPVPGDVVLTEEPNQPKADAPRLRKRPPLIPAAILGVIVLVGVGWFGLHSFVPVKAPVTAATPPPVILTEMSMHPAYAAHMTAYLGKLRGSGMGAQWPAFGGSDTLLIIAPPLVKGQTAAWSETQLKQLAQGVYAGFWENRYETGFSDSDSTTCFVLVSDASGRIAAVDLMGTVQ